MTNLYDGFWLPAELREWLITDKTQWEEKYYLNGKEVSSKTSGAVGARWPLLDANQWNILFQYLQDQRKVAPQDFLRQLKEAIAILSQQMHSYSDLLAETPLHILPAYTGYAPEMIQFALNLFDLTPFETLENALKIQLPAAVQKEFISLQKPGGLEGFCKFYKKRPALRPHNLKRKPGKLPYRENVPDTIVGYGAGNVMGTAFLIALLGQISALVKIPDHQSPKKLPVILIKNSRQEPFFGPFLFSALETINPQLVSTLAVMIWDYEDSILQEHILSRADLVMAAAADFTIEQIDQTLQKANPRARFHKHGHKVSFTTVGKDFLSQKAQNTAADLVDLEMVTTLSALDSIIWDQNGCLSSRIHFVERGSEKDHSPLEYSQQLVTQLRKLSQKLPMGAIPKSRIHNRFDQFVTQTGTGHLQVCSAYEDDFVVVLDERPWNVQRFKSLVNSCMERTIVVRPVDSVMDVPGIYLKWIEKQNLQTMYVAIGGKDEGWSPQFAQFADKVGQCGVTSIRAIGQAVFPQLAYSWDGYLPQDLSLCFPEGYFTTVEFNDNYVNVRENFQILRKKLGA